MKKYTVLKPMATTNKKLLINGDVIYVQKTVTVYQVYSPTTRELIGYLHTLDNLKEE